MNAKSVGTIPRFEHPSLDELHWYFFAVGRLTYPMHTVNEKRGRVQLPSELRGRIVMRELVMVIVEPFSYCGKCYEKVLDRVYVDIVGFIAPHVRSAVDQPGGVQGEAVAEEATGEVGGHQILTPQVVRDDRGEDEAHEDHTGEIQPSLPYANGIFEKVAYIDELTFVFYFRVLSD